MSRLSDKSKDLKQSGIRSASVKCAAIGGINLGQGVCDIPVIAPIKQAAYDAIERDKSIYSPYNGIRSLRFALAEKIKQFNRINAEPDTQIMVSHGSTGAYVCAINALFNAGDEVILFEPFYGYHKNILELNGITVKSVAINLQTLSIDMDEVRAAVTPLTRGMVICTPNNPTGKVYSQQELLALGNIARENDLYMITDEIYEYITYPGYEHVSIASLEDHFERTLTISGFSKTFNMTGWRLGYVSGPQEIIEKMSLLQDLIYVCPPTPLQYACITALNVDEEYYTNLAQEFLTKRDHVVQTLNDLGFKVPLPQGAYYLMADISELGLGDDEAVASYLLDNAKVASVPGRSFHLDKNKGHNIIRICYALREEKINMALEQITKALA